MDASSSHENSSAPWLARVKEDPRAISAAPLSVRSDRDIVLAAVQRSGFALKDAASDLQADRDIVLAAVRRTGYALGYASPALRADREIVLASLHDTIASLRFAASSILDDKETMMAAVQQNGGALYYASDALKADKDIVLAALQENASAMDYVPKTSELRVDREVFLATLKESSSAARAVSEVTERQPLSLKLPRPPPVLKHQKTAADVFQARQAAAEAATAPRWVTRVIDGVQTVDEVDGRGVAVGARWTSVPDFDIRQILGDRVPAAHQRRSSMASLMTP